MPLENLMRVFAAFCILWVNLNVYAIDVISLSIDKKSAKGVCIFNLNHSYPANYFFDGRCIDKVSKATFDKETKLSMIALSFTCINSPSSFNHIVNSSDRIKKYIEKTSTNFARKMEFKCENGALNLMLISK